MSKDKQGNNLPCGNGLLENLKEKFPKIAAFNDLSKVSTVLEKSMERDEFKEYLTNRFTVDEYDKLYENMPRINVKNPFSSIIFYHFSTTRINCLNYIGIIKTPSPKKYRGLQWMNMINCMKICPELMLKIYFQLILMI